MKILLIHPDSPNNRGDRAILAGSIKLLRHKWPNAEIWAFSEQPERDAKWLDVHFVNIPVQSMNPLNQIRIMRLARQCDLVFWGGGEILKDYTNKFALWYWVAKMYLVYLVNKNLYGFFQGIGPTAAPSSKRLIAFIVNRTRVFFVRDQESKDKLEAWGATSKVVASYDTAVIAELEPFTKSLSEKLRKKYGIDKAFLESSFGVTPKAWFHYKHGGIIPYKYRHKLTRKKPMSPDTEMMYANFAAVVDKAIETHDLNAIFFPMHLSQGEGDPRSAREVIKRMKHKNRTRVVDEDLISPAEFISTIGKMKFFVGIRLHSTIIASIAKVPALVFYYVDKGRLFFEQLDMQHYSHPVEDLLDSKKLPVFDKKVDELAANRSKLSKSVASKVDHMRATIYKDFEAHIDESLS